MTMIPKMICPVLSSAWLLVIMCPIPDDEPISYQYEGGVRDFVRHVNSSREVLFEDVGYFRQAEDGNAGSMEVEIAFQWNSTFNTDGLHSFANGINTIEGGMHEEGFKVSLPTHRNDHR